MTIFEALEELKNSDVATIAKAVSSHDYEWPRNLTSGVMFYDGLRIIRQEFEAYKIAYPDKAA